MQTGAAEMAVLQDRTAPSEGNPPSGWIADSFSLAKNGTIEEAPAPSGGNEAELARAWKEYIAADRELDSLPLCPPKELLDPILDRVHDAMERLIRYPATTTAAAAIKLRLLLSAKTESSAAYNAALYDVPPPIELLEDCLDRLAWNLIGDLERMTQPAA
jgi:hypothetical protein